MTTYIYWAAIIVLAVVIGIIYNKYKVLKVFSDNRERRIVDMNKSANKLFIRNGDLELENKELQKELSTFKKLARTGWRSLGTREELYYIKGMSEHYSIVVFGCHPDASDVIIIKEFPFDPKDEEDKAFAIREAEELIEILKAK